MGADVGHVPPNITPDKQTGIGQWSESDFKRMMRTGIGHGGKRLYPAMPYPSYTKMNDGDLSDLWKYLQTVEPVDNEVTANQLPFPFNIRLSLVGWNLLNFSEGEFKPDPDKSLDWNRGKYLVDGAAHCSTCHTPKNLMGADKVAQSLQGASLQGWFAPDITNSKRTGLGSWSEDDIVTYLETGVNAKTVASGPMAEAVQNSTSKMEKSDLRAIAEYLKSLPGEQEASTQTPVAENVMELGRAVYRDNCSACHGSDGKGSLPLFPALAGNQIVVQKSSETLSRLILFGSQGVATSQRPTAPSMPSLAWRLSDQQIADVLTYVRNSWGNSASVVSSDEVSQVRPR
ncbi:c-type cytochrome [Ochrobactrum soli]|uniref:Diheme cytochrome c-553 n=1 Tax=Ochrobactrum soli TaxID=2448455 RepID=A0A2P9HE99_9HYPH|nr:cytochrome c [[Ochrobactrum] soli]SPL62413.1 Putative diheme cytochrome c-553 [[Ochrobactrum] soli]